MIIRKVIHHGKLRWLADLGTRDGGRQRRFFKTERQAKSALAKAQKDKVAIGKRWADLPADGLRSSGQRISDNIRFLNAARNSFD